MTIIVNPGSGPVDGPITEQHAITNMQRLLRDAGLEDAELSRVADRVDDEGRYRFTVSKDGIEVPVDMPGIPLEQVRYMREAGQNIWHFPRLYVNDSSYVWVYAISCLAANWEEGEQSSN